MGRVYRQYVVGLHRRARADQKFVDARTRSGPLFSALLGKFAPELETRVDSLIIHITHARMSAGSMCGPHATSLGKMGGESKTDHTRA